MNLRSSILSLFLGACLAACGGDPAPDVPAAIEIAPQDFVILPCGSDREDRPCALAVAGGKRILFGAPAGAAATLATDDLRQLDAVMVFSLRAADIEGLDEIRNESWQAGRDTPLLVIGPRGTSEVASAINRAFEQADALRIVEEGIPPGGYDAAILEALIWREPRTVFDTGDVKVDIVPDGFRVDYDGRGRAIIQSCRAEPDVDSAASSERVTVALGCHEGVSDAIWPLRSPLVIVQKDKP